MPVPNTIADLNQSPGVNSPLGTDTVGPNLDDYLRALSAFIRQLFDGTPHLLGSIGGTADAITATSSVPFTAYVLGQSFRMVPAATNTTNAVTLNINGIGTKTVTKNGTQALAPGDLVAGVASAVLYDGTQFQLITAPGSQVGSDAYSVRGLTGQNNAAFPNTRMDFIADAVTMRSTNGSPAITRFATGVLTNDIAVAGPAANGRDQASAFSANSWLHYYFIWNGTTIATIASLSAPPAGPTMPTGYTHWAYIAAFRYNATPVLMKCYIRSSKVWYDIGTAGLTRALNGGVSAAYANVPLAALVPPNAVVATVNALVSVIHNAPGVGFNMSLIPSGSTLAGDNRVTSAVTQVAGISADASNMLDIPVGTATQIAYKLSAAPSTAGGAYVDVFGYTVPNGG